jgi:hypothetical protein
MGEPGFQRRARLLFAKVSFAKSFPFSSFLRIVLNFHFGLPELAQVYTHSACFKYEKRLEDLYNILTRDLRGHGQSMKYKNYADYEITNFAQDIYVIVYYLKLQTSYSLRRKGRQELRWRIGLAC